MIPSQWNVEIERRARGGAETATTAPSQTKTGASASCTATAFATALRSVCEVCLTALRSVSACPSISPSVHQSRKPKLQDHTISTYGTRRRGAAARVARAAVPVHPTPRPLHPNRSISHLPPEPTTETVQPYLERIRQMQARFGIATVFIATQDARILHAAMVSPSPPPSPPPLLHSSTPLRPLTLPTSVRAMVSSSPPRLPPPRLPSPHASPSPCLRPTDRIHLLSLPLSLTHNTHQAQEGLRVVALPFDRDQLTGKAAKKALHWRQKQVRNTHKAPHWRQSRCARRASTRV